MTLRPRSAGPKTPYGVDDLVESGELVHYLVCARFGGLREATGVQAGAKDQHSRAWTGPAQLRDEIRSGAVWEPQVQDHHVEPRGPGVPAGFGQRFGLGYHFEIGLPAQQGRHKVPEVGLILDQHYADPCCELFHPYPSCGDGTRNRTLVLRPISLAISRSPPRMAVRSRMLLRPTPEDVPGPNPCPSSETSTTRSPPQTSGSPVLCWLPSGAWRWSAPPGLCATSAYPSPPSASRGNPHPPPGLSR